LTGLHPAGKHAGNPKTPRAGLSAARQILRQKPKEQAEQERQQDNQGNFPAQHLLFPASFFAFVHALQDS
jgi:hypothetical protein